MVSYDMTSYDMISYDMISYDMISYDMIAAADAAAETCSTNGKPNFFGIFQFENDIRKNIQKLKISEMCLPQSGMKFCIEKWSDHFLIFFLDLVYGLQTFSHNLCMVIIYFSLHNHLFCPKIILSIHLPYWENTNSENRIFWEYEFTNLGDLNKIF